METEIMVALPKATYYWSEDWMKVVYRKCESALKTEYENTPTVSKEYRHCLERGRETIIENMMDLIIDRGYFCPQYGTGMYVLYWRDAPQCMAKFVRLLETVFTRDNQIRIRGKKLAPVVELKNVTSPKPTEDRSEKAIKIYEDCESALKLLEKNPAIISDKYRQCLQRGRNVIIENMKKFIMDPEYFKKHGSSTEYQLYWEDAPQVLARFLHDIETVFTGDKELKLREKNIIKIRKEIVAIPPNSSLVALVEAREARVKSGILKIYEQMESLCDKEKLELLAGKRILNEKWAEEGEAYNLSGEAKAMLCMHLWSLMIYVGFVNSHKIWEVISRGWEECVSWEEGSHGEFWTLIQSDQVPLRDQAVNKGMKPILEAYKSMEIYFKGDSQHCLKHYKDAYYLTEINPYP